MGGAGEIFGGAGRFCVRCGLGRGGAGKLWAVRGIFGGVRDWKE